MRERQRLSAACRLRARHNNVSGYLVLSSLWRTTFAPRCSLHPCNDSIASCRFLLPVLEEIKFRSCHPRFTGLLAFFIQPESRTGRAGRKKSAIPSNRLVLKPLPMPLRYDDDDGLTRFQDLECSSQQQKFETIVTGAMASDRKELCSGPPVCWELFSLEASPSLSIMSTRDTRAGSSRPWSPRRLPGLSLPKLW